MIKRRRVECGTANSRMDLARFALLILSHIGDCSILVIRNEHFIWFLLNEDDSIKLEANPANRSSQDLLNPVDA